MYPDTYLAVFAVSRADANVGDDVTAFRLDPLSACNHTVVAEFSRLTGRLHLLPSGALRPALLPADAAAAPRRPLQMFFPFDPYLLHYSARYLDLQARDPIE